MNVLPPGTILQLMYLRERLEKIPPGRFIEIGPGSGEITSLLLELGWRGHSYDLESRTVERLRTRFSQEISTGRYEASNQDYLALATSPNVKVDLIISCMVMEHFSNELESKFMCHSLGFLKDGGLMIGLVPASPDHWGIEDDIAGHFRRYTRDKLKLLANENKWDIRHISGLTFPLSNLLLPVSNFLVRRAEGSKMSMSNIEKTKASGIRDVRFKTNFPPLLSLVLNRYFLIPLHWLQKIFASTSGSLVLYFEAVPSQTKMGNS